MNADRLRENLERVQSAIAGAARHSGREPQSVGLVAVTKRVEPEVVRELIGLGAHDLGENYPQELWRKAEALADLSVRWHLIGHLQGNKLKRTAPLVCLIHSVDSLKLLQAIDDLVALQPADQRPAVLLQVNCSAEEAKHGWSPAAVENDAEAIAACRNVPVVGLMTMAGYGTTPEEARPSFVQLRTVRDRLRSLTGLALPELSMGMSGDFVAAIEEGATRVRVGSALFEGVTGA